MSRVRIRARDIELELSGSEAFVLRQLELLSSYLGNVDTEVLSSAPPAPVPAAPPVVAQEPEPEPAPEAAAPPPREATNGGPAPAAAPHAVNGGGDAPDELIRFYGRFQPQGLDRQSDAALLFAYYLQQREGLPALQLGDLIRCCIRAGVDTRNFNRTLGILTRRGYLETVRHGHAYRLSDHGVAAVESRM